MSFGTLLNTCALITLFQTCLDTLYKKANSFLPILEFGSLLTVDWLTDFVNAQVLKQSMKAKHQSCIKLIDAQAIFSQEKGKKRGSSFCCSQYLSLHKRGATITIRLFWYSEKRKKNADYGQWKIPICPIISSCHLLLPSLLALEFFH
mgnify:FL=1